MTAPDKVIGLGTTFSMSTSVTTASSLFTAIAGIIDLPGPDATGTDIDTSTIDNDTNFQTFQRGQVDPGSMNLTLSYSQNSASQKKLVTALNSGNLRSFRITHTATGFDAEVFDGYVSGMGRPQFGKDSMIQRSVAIKLSGGTGFVST